MPDDVLRLVLGGRQFEGWLSTRVTRSIESGSGSFELQVTEREPLHPELRAIHPGEPCAIRIDADVLITGYVDEVSPSFDASQHSISVRGRDAVADLIDCAPDITPAVRVNQGLLDLARSLAKPFGIPVRTEVDLGLRFVEVATNAGETPWELIEKHARYRQVLAVSDGVGGLLFTRAGTRRLTTALVEGQNVLSASATYSHVERHSVYIVKGQSFDTGDQGADAGRPTSGPILDREIKRFRPLMIVANTAVDNDRCIQRARWEALTRAARGAAAEVTVQGWRDATGALWALNTLVPLRSPTLGLSGEFLISEVSYVLDGSGTRTTLSLVRPDAFTVSPEREPPPLELGQTEVDEE